MGQPTLNMDAFQNTNDDNKFKLWKEGVNPVKISKKPGEMIWLKLLPSFDCDDAGNTIPGTTIPCRTVDGQPTAWGAVVYMCNYVGYGKPGAGGARRDFIGLNTFGNDERCLLSEVVEAAYNDRENWGFLVGQVWDESTGKWTKTINRDEEMLKRPTAHLFVNAIDYADRSAKVNLMYMTKSAATAFFAPDGLLNTPNTNATDEGVKADYNSAYSSGDFTNVSTGAVVCIQREDKATGINGYNVSLAITQEPGKAPALVGLPVNATQLAERYDLSQPATFLKKPTPEAVLADICAVCNRWSPDGKRHPYALLKQLFGAEFNVPEIPEKPYSREVPVKGAQVAAPANAMAAAFGGPPAAVTNPTVITPTAVAGPAVVTPTAVTPTVMDAGSLDPQVQTSPKPIPVEPVNNGDLPEGVPGGNIDADSKAAFMAELANA